MTEAQRRLAIHQIIKKYTAANTATKQDALNALVREGIYDENGQLTEQFGGEPQSSKRGH